MSYNEKFAGLLDAIKQAKEAGAEMIVPSPQTLGDDYAELVESLNRLSTANVALRIVPPKERGRPGYSRN